MRNKSIKPKLSAVIIARNEEEKIGDCLRSVDFADEIILVDTGSTDKTAEIAEKHGARVIKYTGGGFSDWRNKGAREAKGNWLLYIDSDERVTPALKREIKSVISRRPSAVSHYAIPRRNFILGKEMKYGGWWPDYVKFLIRKRDFVSWKGELHEEPVVQGKLGHLKSPFIHLKHDNLSDMVKKTNDWSEIEAKLLFKAGHPRMSWWRFFRIMATELWYRLIVKKGFLDGTEGVIYAFYQMWSRFVTYGKLWELQITNHKSRVTNH